MSRTKICFKPNSISYDFPYPIKYENISEKPNLSPKRNHELGNKKLHQYNNELPESFILKGMIKSEEIYNNPHLEDMPQIDINENNKKLQTTRKIIKLIDKLKYNRKLSQDPKICEKITSEQDLMHRKINKIKLRNEKLSKNFTSFSTTDIKPKMVLSIDEKNLPKVLDLHRNFIINNNTTRNFGNKLIKQINKDSLVYLDKEKKIKCSKLDINKLNKLQSIIDIQHSSYIADINNYNIKENVKEDERCFFEFERSPIIMYDPILNENKLYNLPNLKINKWDKYNEAFSLMDNKLYKKGGIFSEYIKMNRLGFQMIQRERKEKLKKNKIKFKFPKKIIKKINFNDNYNYFSDDNLKKSLPKIKKIFSF